MAIVYPLDVPLQEFSEVDVESVDINSLQTATFTGKERVQEFEGDYWVVNIRYRNLDQTLGRQMSAFIRSLRGSLGTFIVRFPGYTVPRGRAAGQPVSPLVDGNGQAGKRELKIKGASPDIEEWLLAGDIIQVGPPSRPHWHEVLTDVNTDGTGKATIDVWPSIRNAIDNDPVVLNNPLGLCRLVSSNAIPIRPPVLYDLTINARESTGDT